MIERPQKIASVVQGCNFCQTENIVFFKTSIVFSVISRFYRPIYQITRLLESNVCCEEGKQEELERYKSRSREVLMTLCHTTFQSPMIGFMILF